MKTFLFIVMVYSVEPGMLQSVPNVTIGHPSKIEQKIVKGYNCRADEYKYLASILSKEYQHCGGSLIASRWVLTAAHCCKSIMERISRYSVIVGMRVWKQLYEQRSMIAEVHMHPNYSDQTFENDMCVLKLQDEIRTNNNVQLSKLATSVDYRGLLNKKGWIKVTVIGFGAQQERTRINVNPYVQCATLFVAGPDGACLTRISTAFCASDPEKRERSPCYGDSGGPLFCNGVQIGLASSSFGCELQGYPGYFTRVDIYREFIDGLIRNNFRDEEDNRSSKPPQVTPVSYTKILVLFLIVCYCL